MPRLTALFLVLLAACTQTIQRDGFRRDAPIYSNAVLDLSTLNGTWPQVATPPLLPPASPPAAPAPRRSRPDRRV